MNIKENLEKACEMIEKEEEIKFDEDLYNRIYSFTTENVSDYLKHFTFKNKSLLTVGSSGDQILNSYLYGARDITLLDVNTYAPYYIYLKAAGVFSLTYQEFKEFFYLNHGNKLNYNRYNIELFNKLSNNLKAMNYDAYYFFNYIFNTYEKDKIGKYLFNDDQNSSKIITKVNKYLESEDTYNKLKNIIRDFYIKFINADMFKYEGNIKFDNIFLSNLCTLVNLYDLRELLFKLKKNNLNIDGSMLIAYIWNTRYESDEVNFDLKQVYNMPSTRDLLKDFISEHYAITGVSDILFDTNRKSDLVLIYRNKNK